MDYRTGSTVPNGTLPRQLAMRRTDSQLPRSSPYFFTASTEYCEQVGRYRQRGVYLPSHAP